MIQVYQYMPLGSALGEGGSGAGKRERLGLDSVTTRAQPPHGGWSPVALQSCPKLGQGAVLDFIPPHQPVFGRRLTSGGSEIFTESALSRQEQSMGRASSRLSGGISNIWGLFFSPKWESGQPSSAQHPLISSFWLIWSVSLFLTLKLSITLSGGVSDRWKCSAQDHPPVLSQGL